MPIQITIVDVTHRMSGREVPIAQFIHSDTKMAQWIGVVTSNNAQYPTQLEIQTKYITAERYVQCTCTAVGSTNPKDHRGECEKFGRGYIPHICRMSDLVCGQCNKTWIEMNGIEMNV
jgi:hypothetical protein